MKKTFVLLLGLLMSVSVSVGKTYDWEKNIAAFEKADLKNPPPKGGIEFVGSSTMTRWTTLKDYFPGLPVFNRGFGGSEISDSVRYAPRIIIPYAPRIIVKQPRFDGHSERNQSVPEGESNDAGTA